MVWRVMYPFLLHLLSMAVMWSRVVRDSMESCSSSTSSWLIKFTVAPESIGNEIAKLMGMMQLHRNSETRKASEPIHLKILKCSQGRLCTGDLNDQNKNTARGACSAVILLWICRPLLAALAPLWWRRALLYI